MSLSPHQPEDIARDISHFRSLAPRLCALFSKENIEASPWQSSDLPFFASLEVRRRNLILNSFEIQIEIFERCLNNGGSLLNTWPLAEEFVQRTGLAFAADLEQFKATDDYVVIYNAFHGMSFVSPNHFRHMSYSLEDLYCRLWITLFRRDENIEKLLIERVMPFAQGRNSSTVSNEDVPAHIIAETTAPGMRSVTVRSKAYSPMFRNGMPDGFLSINCGVAPTSRMLPRPPGLTFS